MESGRQSLKTVAVAAVALAYAASCGPAPTTDVPSGPPPTETSAATLAPIPSATVGEMTTGTAGRLGIAPGARLFPPSEIGTWTAVARIPARGLETGPVAFQVRASENPGFVRVHPQNPRYLAFDDGTFFFPIGANMGWWSGAGTALGDYYKG